ncbi:DUF2288 domain-containing protein [Aurantivibrio plasticivorans]
MMNKDSDTELFEKLNRETAKIDWKGLEPHYAMGSLVVVSPGTDLVQVAIHFAKDNAKEIQALLESGQLERVQEGQAEEYGRAEATFWAVVVAPWVLIQDVK